MSILLDEVCLVVPHAGQFGEGSIAGALVSVGKWMRPESWVAQVLAAENRAEAGATAYAKGPFLVTVS